MAEKKIAPLAVLGKLAYTLGEFLSEEEKGEG